MHYHIVSAFIFVSVLVLIDSLRFLGSRNGTIKLWQCGENFRSLNLLFEVKLTGFINALAFTPDGNHLIAGVGNEHRSGSWWRIPEARNAIVIIPLVNKQKDK